MNKGLIVVGLLVLAVLVDLFTDATVPGRMALFALVSAFALVLGAKALSRHGLQQVGDRD